MHGCSLAFGLPVNAEVDSMGVVEVGDSAGTGASQQRSAIEKVQAELRQEYDVREERRRELEFLEKGGNPLDFKVGNAAATSVQSTSLTDQHLELFGTSEAKDSFAFTASTHGDSVESSGRPGTQSACGPISADNLMLFDGEHDSIDGDRISGHPHRSNVALRDHSFNLDGSQNAKDIGDSGAIGLARKLYNRRRYRSRPSRDAARSSSSDAVIARVINGSSLLSFCGPRDFKGLVSGREQEQKISLNGDLKPTGPISIAICQTAPSSTQMDSALDIVNDVKSTIDPRKDERADSGKDSNAMKSLDSYPHNLDSLCDVDKDPRKQSMEEPYAFRAPEEVGLEGLDCRASLPVTVVETHVSRGQMKGSSIENLDVKSTSNSVRTDNTTLDSNILESVSSCTQTRLSLDKNVDNDMCTHGRNVDTSGEIKDLAAALGGDESVHADHATKEKDKIEANENDKLDECGSFHQSLEENGFMWKAGEESNTKVSGMHNEVENQGQNELNDQDMVESMGVDGCGVSETGRDTDPFGCNMNPRDEFFCKVGPEGSSSLPSVKQHETEPSVEVANSAFVVQTSSATDLKASRADEDSILEQAQIIEAKRKRIAQLSFSDTPGDCRPKSHWGFVLEEMAWLANDFAQERLWKISAASQVGSRVSLLSLLRFQEQNSRLEGQKVARSLARAVMEFWHSLERKSQGQELQCHSSDYSPALQEYALRFRRNGTSEDRHLEVEIPVTTDRDSDIGIMDISLDDCSKEKNLVYVIPPGAMARYINSMESYMAKFEKTGSSIPEEFETSASDAVADNAYEDDGETSTYRESSKYRHNKLKISTKAFSPRKLEVVADSPFLQCVDNKVGNQQTVSTGKRPANSFNVSFPTRRVRTSNRQRVLCSFTAGTPAYAQGPTKTDASSGDTNSFQDDQSTLDGVSRALNNLETGSGEDFDKRLSYGSAEVSPRPKKKARHLGSAYEQRWLVDSNFQNDQRDHYKNRLKSLQLESNGVSGLFGHHIAKKPKIDNAIESSSQHGGSAPSPVASQISTPNKFSKYFGGRGRARKTKMLKIPASQPGPGSPWSLFEEQALVVLVHDLGPNWELVSDAVSSTLQFKCIFRSPAECKERHKQLMDTTSVDGADSAEDSGSSQPYSSTLPGIPKGSARQLFQRLQGPMEEDTLKSHFEKIIMIGQKLHCRRKQEPKQIQPPHGSHMVALMKARPNNLNGGPILTPLDLCEATACSSDVLPLGYPDAHSSVLPTSNQGIMAPMLTSSGANSLVQGSSNLTTGNNFSSSPAPVNASLRDARYALPKSASSTIEEQGIQQYNQMFAGRNVSQSNLSSPEPLPANDRTLRMIPGSNGVPVAGGGNRSLPIARSGFQGIASSSMLNAGNTVSSSMVTMPSMVGCGQVNSSRPQEALHMMPTQAQDPQRQMMVPELQKQVSQGSNPGISPYAGMTSAFPNQTASPPYNLHHQQLHTMPPQQLHSISPRHAHIKGNSHLPNPQHQAYAIRLAKEKQLKQSLLQQQQQQQQQHQQQFQSHNSLMSHVQSHSQLPISSPPHNSSQVTLQTTTPPVSLSPLTPNSPMTAVPQHHQQHQNMPPGTAQNAQSPNSSMTNQGKQRQRQALQKFAQSGRHHPQQRQQTQSQQQAKVSKGGRGNITMHQKMATEPSGSHALSVDPGNHLAENGEPPMHLLQGQGIYSRSAMNHVSAGNPLLRQSSNQAQPVQRVFAGQATSISKHLQQKPCDSDGVNHGQVSQVSSGPSSMAQQSVPSVVMAASGQQQPQLQGRSKLVNQSQPSVQRVLHQNLHLNSESTKLQGREPRNEQILKASSQMGTAATVSYASNDVTNVSKVISPARDTPWRGSEVLTDSGSSSPAPHRGTSGTASTRTEPSCQLGQGPVERHLSDNLPSVSNDVGTQWQQKPVHLPPSPHVFQQLQQQEQSLQQQMLPLSVSQPQTQLKGSMYVRPPESMLE